MTDRLTHPGVCIHGGLRRQCETCDIADRLTASEAALAAATQEIERLKAERDSANKHIAEAHSEIRRRGQLLQHLDAADAEVVRQRERAEAAERQRDALREAILWALGERDEFPAEPEPLAGKYRRRYWWRKELRQRAGAALAATEGQ